MGPGRHDPDAAGPPAQGSPDRRRSPVDPCSDQDPKSDTGLPTRSPSGSRHRSSSCPAVGSIVPREDPAHALSVVHSPRRPAAAHRQSAGGSRQARRPETGTKIKKPGCRSVVVCCTRVTLPDRIVSPVSRAARGLPPYGIRRHVIAECTQVCAREGLEIDNGGIEGCSPSGRTRSSGNPSARTVSRCAAKPSAGIKREKPIPCMHRPEPPRRGAPQVYAGCDDQSSTPDGTRFSLNENDARTSD